ncbi:MAG TPA: polyhydroxyalkanoic acid system family protein [Rhodothermales bacterium]|nr:polyhydroxyalkanoic acid system family protein [Rhodothermales bacterium]HRR08335.1 polyhydroxyalkanoic acid system family protein [Rhodothermales bacterium]
MAVVIERTHSYTMEQMRKKMHYVIEKLQSELDLTTIWKGDTVHFSRMGIDGIVFFDQQKLKISAKIPFYVPISDAWLKNEIESRIDHYLKEAPDA